MTTPTSASAALSPATSPALSAPGRAAPAPGGTSATGQGRAPRRKISIPLLRRSRRRDLVEVPARADVLALCSVLLGYPDEALYADLDLLGEAVAALPASAPAAHLAVFWRAFTGQTPAQARAHYVETFDLRRRSSLFLSYYLHGDTRQRGMALLSLKQRYRACGFTPEEGELPDYLPMVLEFASRAGTGAGEGVLRAHRPGIELIRRSLADRGSWYQEILEAVSVLLGPVSDRHRTEADQLASSGPPSDDAGLEIAAMPYGSGWTGSPGTPFGPPEYTCAPAGRQS
ncbi:nitrate reductase molybdenum cofactor assembly chaperone [Sanguibacter inulinus]|uniref:Nitrate reductase molybdenum cofactor assembly chaperone n=1 Tax=Sanguibacter inulinus TaxID=60922 RepID=A0A853EY33_9MICO|nr:nitrate reductase molybdenum cofactor assembly chaperone [Sanguibacter inulinus]MBF0723609.1 nitrate reductase molybdenum cofactor assembly chaperone [Sanguibacter inulinus]NYS94754.1 nitrate reductase molybdenum cofactor assembly chaperone [Sanguibacter inulinus]